MNFSIEDAEYENATPPFSINNDQIAMTNKYRIVLTLPSPTIGEGINANCNLQ
jgi:hypothetical protein